MPRGWGRLRLEVLQRDRWLCQCDECKALGRVRAAQEVDHIVPRARNGSSDPSNLRAIAHSCHVRVTLLQQNKRPRPTIGLDGYPVDDDE